MGGGSGCGSVAGGVASTRQRGAPHASGVPLELVEVAQRRAPRPDPRPQRHELVGRDLAERPLHSEIRDVEVLLVDDRRDPRVDLDHVVADELDVEEVLDLELGHDAVGDLHQRLVLERDEVHREPGAHRLARLRVAEQDPLAVGNAVDRALTAGRELHHEQVGATLGREQLDRLLEPHRNRPGPLVQQLVRAVDGRVEDPEAARPGGEHRLEAHRHVGVAELAGGGLDLGGAVDPAERRRRQAEPVQELVRLGLVVRAEDRVGLGHEHGHGERVAVLGEPLEIERRLGQHAVGALALDDRADGGGEVRIRARRDDVEGVAEVPADGALGHVGADEPKLALAVLAEPAEQGSGAGAPEAVTTTVIGLRLMPGIVAGRRGAPRTKRSARGSRRRCRRPTSRASRAAGARRRRGDGSRSPSGCDGRRRPASSTRSAASSP